MSPTSSQSQSDAPPPVLTESQTPAKYQMPVNKQGSASTVAKKLMSQLVFSCPLIIMPLLTRFPSKSQSNPLKWQWIKPVSTILLFYNIPAVFKMMQRTWWNLKHGRIFLPLFLDWLFVPARVLTAPEQRIWQLFYFKYPSWQNLDLKPQPHDYQTVALTTKVQCLKKQGTKVKEKKYRVELSNHIYLSLSI